MRTNKSAGALRKKRLVEWHEFKGVNMKALATTKALAISFIAATVFVSANAYATEGHQHVSFDKKPVSGQMQPTTLLQRVEHDEDNKQRTEKQCLLNKKLPYITKSA
jgi:hypothetical protein